MTKAELIKRLRLPEWSDLECKKAKNGVSDDAYRTVSAFANSEGGTLIFGIQQTTGNLGIEGVTNPDKIQNDFLSALRTGEKLNRKISATAEMLDFDGKVLLIFHIPESPRNEKPVYLNGDIRKCYIRRGAGDEQCTQVEIERFLRDSSTDRFDATIADYDIQSCFDSSSLSWYRFHYENRPSNRSYAYLDNFGFLFQLGLIKNTSSGMKPTNASILLFGNDGCLRGLLPRPIADCQRFAFRYDETSLGSRWLDRIILESNIINAWLSFLDWYYRLSPVPFKVDPLTMERKDTPDDFIVFREVFINILCHQDYQEHTRKPEIRNFSDRTLFWNPGDAFSHGDLLSPGPKDVRNPSIVNALRRIGLSENAGWGLNDVHTHWIKLGFPPPIISNGKSNKDFLVTLISSTSDTKQQTTEQVTEQVTELLRVLTTELKAKEILNKLNLKHREHFRVGYLLPALEAGLIEMMQPDSPNSPTQRYRITPKGRKILKNIRKD